MLQKFEKTKHAKTLYGTHVITEKPILNPHIHDKFEIYYSISGGDKFYLDNKIYDILPHDLFVIPPDTVHITTNTGEKYDRYVVYAPLKIMKPLDDNITDMIGIFKKACNNVSHKVSLNEAQHEKFVYLLEKFIACSGYAKDMLECMHVIDILIFACELFENNTVSSYSYNVDERDANRIMSFIEENLAGDLSLNNIEKSLGIKAKSINRIFKKATNTTVCDYIINRRITEAKKLLLENVSVTDTCEKVGFKSYSHFGQTFIKLVGKSPKQYSQHI